MDDKKKNLAVLFPGRGYSVAYPLLYFAEASYSQKGYEIIKIHYGDNFEKGAPFDEILDNISKMVAEQMRDVHFSEYGDIVFISKSVGTVIAGQLAETLGESNIRHIFLTPIMHTLAYIKKNGNKGIVIAGTQDPYMDANVITTHCENENTPLELIEGANHSLAIAGDIPATLDALKRVVLFAYEIT